MAKVKKEDIKKVVLAYSGGLDTSVIIPWLKENSGSERRLHRKLCMALRKGRRRI